MNSPYFNPNTGSNEAATVTNKEFLAEVFRGINTETETIWTTFYPMSPEKATELGEPWRGQACKIEQVPDSDNCNAYFSTSTVSPHKNRRVKNSLQRAYCLVLDDSEDGIDLAPSWVLQTSENSKQYGYIFSEPTGDLKRYDTILRSIKKMGTADKAGNSAVRYVRLPRAINNKEEYGGEPFMCKLVEWNPQNRYTLEQLEAEISGTSKPQIDSDGVVSGPSDAFAAADQPTQPAGGTGRGDLITTIITAGAGLHDAVAQLAWREVNAGVNPNEIRHELRTLMQLVPQEQRDERWKARYAEIDHAINSAIQKVAENHKAETAVNLIAKPFDATSPVSRREFITINGMKSYSRGFLTVTGAAGGTGKSSLAIVEELSVVLGVDLFDPQRTPLEAGPQHVWSMSLEDDEQEHRRRVLAAMYHYGIKAEDLGDRYHVTYRADSPVTVVAAGPNNQLAFTPQVDQIKEVIREHGIVLLNVDPFVSSHQANENDNGAMNTVADAWRSIAQETHCAINLTHHLRKTNGLTETDTNDLRGAVSLTAAARIVRVLSNPTQDEAARVLGIDPDERRFFFWVNPGGKPNIAPPAQNRVWFRMCGVDLMNGTDDKPGDNVGVATRFEPPNPMDSVTADDVRRLAARLNGKDDDYLIENCRVHPRAKLKWFGSFLATEILAADLDPDNPGDKAKLTKIIKQWTANKVIVEVSKKLKNGDETRYYAIGPGAFDSVLDDLSDI